MIDWGIGSVKREGAELSLVCRVGEDVSAEHASNEGDGDECK